MRHLKALSAALACGAVLASTTGAAQAGPSTQSWDFYDCSGPAGTPASFSATRQGAVGNALHLANGGGTFVVLYAYNDDLGMFNVPVVSPGKQSRAMVQCSTIGPAFGFHLTVWGLIGGR